MSEKLKPCPFCGSEAKPITESDPFTWCTNQRCEVYDIETHYKIWNRTHEKEVCPECGGDGIERCDNPDHGFIEAMPGELSRLGCPVCGHDPEYRVSGHPECPTCHGTGEKPDSTKELFDEAVDELTYARTILMGWDSSFINDMNQMNISRDTQDAVKTIDGLLTRINEQS